MKIKTAITNFIVFTLLLFLVPSINAQTLDPSNDSVTVNANINVDLYSTVNVNPKTVEIYQPSNVEVRVLSPSGVGIPGRQIVIYGTGLSVTQPISLTDATGRTNGSVWSTTPGTYTVCAKDTTFGFDIFIQNCDTLYVVPVPVPTMLPEPQYTKGFTNLVLWGSLGANYKYNVQVSEFSDFRSIKAQAGYITSTSFEFTNLENGKMYFYRVRAQNLYGGLSAWSNIVYSVQDAQAPSVEVLDMGNIGENVATQWDPNYELTFLIKVTDNLELSNADFFCLNSGGNLESCTSNYSMEGDLLTVVLRLSDLESIDGLSLRESYKFCVEASDVAENVVRYCDINLNIPVYIEEPEEPKPPVVVVPPTGIDKVIEDIDVILDDTIGRLESDDLERITTTTTVVTASSAIIIAAGTLASLPYFLLQLFLNLISLFGFRKGAKPVGFVYDSVTKEPISQAIVRIFNEQGRMIWTDVTDAKGYFSAKLKEGKYRIEVRASRYTFPSKVVFGREDLPIINVYHGEVLDVGQSIELNISVPLDPVEISKLRLGWEGFWTRAKFVVHILHMLLFVVGLVLAIYMYYTVPSTLSLIVLLLFIPTFILIVRNILIGRRDRYGVVTDEKGNRLEGVLIGLREAEFGKIVAKRITGASGRYRFFVDDGRYYLENLDTDYIVKDIEGGNEIFTRDEELITKDITLERVKG